MGRSFLLPNLWPGRSGFSYCPIPVHAVCLMADSNQSIKSLVGAESLRISHPAITNAETEKEHVLLVGALKPRWRERPSLLLFSLKVKTVVVLILTSNPPTFSSRDGGASRFSTLAWRKICVRRASQARSWRSRRNLWPMPPKNTEFQIFPGDEGLPVLIGVEEARGRHCRAWVSLCPGICGSKGKQH